MRPHPDLGLHVPRLPKAHAGSGANKRHWPGKVKC